MLAVQFDIGTGNIVGAGLDGSIRAWKLQRGTMRRIAVAEAAHEGWVRALCSHASSKLVVSSGDDGLLRTWKLEKDALKPMASTGGNGSAESHGIQALTYVAAKSLILSSSSDGALRAWRVEGEAVVCVAVRMGAHTSGVSVLEYSAEKAFVLTGGSDGDVKVWSFAGDSFDEVLEVPGAHAGGVVSVSWDVSKGMLVTAGADGFYRIWDVGSECRWLHAVGEVGSLHKGGPTAVRLTANAGVSGYIFTAGKDGVIQAWPSLQGELQYLGVATGGSGGKAFAAMPGTESAAGGYYRQADLTPCSMEQ